MPRVSPAVAMSRDGHVRRLLGGVLALTVSVGGFAFLVPPAFSASVALTRSTGPVAVALSGTLSTAGLAEHPTVSLLTVSNIGAQPLVWTLRPRAAGDASTLTLDYWPATSRSCGAGTGVVGSPPIAPVEAGAAIDVCVRMSLQSHDAGRTITPEVTVVAHPA